MPLFNLLKNKKDKFLVLDCGESAVKGLVFERREQGNVLRKFYCQEIERFGVFNGRNFEIEVIEKAIQKLIKNLEIEAQLWGLSPIVTFSPEILKARVIEVSLKRKQGSEKISKEEQRKIFEVVFKEAKKKLFSQVKKEKEIVFEDLQVVKQKVLEEKIAGYKVPSLIGFRGENLSLELLVIFVWREHLQFVQKLFRLFKLKEAQISHEIEGLINWQKVSQNNKATQLFLDIGFANTQLFCFDGNLRLADEFPLGGRDFAEPVAKNFGIKEKEAEILLQRSSEGQLSQQARNKIKELSSPVFSQWFNNLEQTLKEKIKTFEILPQKTFLFGGGALLPGIKETLEKTRVKILESNDLPVENKTGTQLSARAVPSILLALK